MLYRTGSTRHFSAYAYLIATLCFSIQAIGIGINVAYGVFFNPLMTEFGWSRAVISGAASVCLFMMGLFGVAVGRLNDHFGPKKLMTVTAILLGTGLLLTSQLKTIWQLYLFYGVVFGIGLSSVDVIALTTVARWFTHKRGLMTGIVKVGTGAGQFILPLLASVLIAAYGWRRTYLIIGAAALVILIIIAQLLRRDPDQQARTGNQRRLKQASPDNTSQDTISGIPEVDLGVDLHDAMRTLQLWIICLVNMTVVFCLMIIVVHIVPHARDIGLEPAQAAGVLSTFGGVSMAGRFITGLSIDRRGSKQMIVACFLLLISGLLWLQLADTLWMLYLFACVYGIAHGGFYTAISPLVAEIFGILSHGALFGIVAFCGTVGGATGPVLAGYLFDITGSYNSSFWLITAMAIMGLGLISTLRPLTKPQRCKSRRASESRRQG